MVNVVTQLFLWQCSIANCWSLPEDKSHIIPLITNVNPLLNHENHHQIITCRSSTLKKRGGHWSRYLDEFTSARTPLNWPVTSWRRDVRSRSLLSTIRCRSTFVYPILFPLNPTISPRHVYILCISIIPWCHHGWIMVQSLRPVAAHHSRSQTSSSLMRRDMAPRLGI